MTNNACTTTQPQYQSGPTLSQGCFWKTPPPPREISADVVWGKNMKRRKRKNGKMGKKKMKRQKIKGKLKLKMQNKCN
jgi:hypothetical protein